MATESRRATAALEADLLAVPEEFEFFQALRLFDHIVASHGKNSPSIGYSSSSNLRFPASGIGKITPQESEGQEKWQVEANIFGLTGSAGVLPYHDTELVQQRARVKDSTLQAFFDLFNSRLINLFHKAWRKYRLPFTFEFQRLQGNQQDDSYTRVLASVAGLGWRTQRKSLPVERDNLLGLAGILGRPARSAIAIQGALRSFFGLPVVVQQFQGEWLSIPEDTQSQLPGKLRPMGMNCELGKNVILGSQGWQIQSKFTVLIQEIAYDQLMELQPGGRKMKQLRALTRFLTRNEYDFDIVITTDAVSIPLLTLDDNPAKPPLLGWNTAVGQERQVKNIRIVVT